MRDHRKVKSIWKRYEKPRGEARAESDGKLYYRINRKTGRIETNILEWERSWKNVKILEYPTRFANELRLGERVQLSFKTSYSKASGVLTTDDLHYYVRFHSHKWTIFSDHTLLQFFVILRK